MDSSRQFSRHFAWLAALNLLLLCGSVFAAPAARVEFAIGNVSAEAADGRARPLLKGATVEEGETVNTNEGRVQLRFTDDGFISLHSQTVFRIDAYRWSGVTDGSERGFFSLVKGGLRTITGRLAKINKKAYQMSSQVATIGVRGTEYTMQSNGDLTGSVTDGEIEVCNAGGCLSVLAGQSYYVADANTKPALSDKQTKLNPPQAFDNRAVPVGTASGTATAATGLVASERLGISRFQAVTNEGLANKLDSTTGGLFGAVTTTSNGLIGFTQGASGSLPGGTGVAQPVQNVTGAAGSALTGITTTLGVTTTGVLNATGILSTGGSTPVNGLSGTSNGITGTGLLGILRPAN